MESNVPDSLGLIAGRGAYPLQLADSARRQGVERICAVGFRGETDSRLAALVNEIQWLRVGQLQRLLDAVAGFGVPVAVMAGQIRPKHLFRVRMDRRMLDLLKRLRTRNAETIFGAVAEELKTVGVTLLPASRFMERHTPQAGTLSRRQPSAREWGDVDLGLRVARASSDLDVGQTVVVKEGTVLAVEAFEGTDAAIRRAGKLGGRGNVVVKVAKEAHDMRFDIPVIGRHTVKTLRKAGSTALAVEAGRCILLERDDLVRDLDALNVAFVAVDRLSEVKNNKPHPPPQSVVHSLGL